MGGSVAVGGAQDVAYGAGVTRSPEGPFGCAEERVATSVAHQTSEVERRGGTR